MKRIPPSARFAAQIPGGERLSVQDQQKVERCIGPRRFGEHTICGEGDYERHVDYIHNPVKHGQVARGADWPYSNFHRYLRGGIYNLEWAADDDVRRLETE